mmetsp:Transcript_3660/g.5316  ORF Transcript_3660/g.5316 Transcript_3660/m.5316 type:complete len:342 (-) Transcript_3660:92-1117(-)
MAHVIRIKLNRGTSDGVVVGDAGAVVEPSDKKDEDYAEEEGIDVSDSDEDSEKEVPKVRKVSLQTLSKLPEQYRNLADLTEQEIKLLEKYTRTKRVVLKVGGAKAQQIEAAARARAAFEEKKRRGGMYEDRDRNLLKKRPRLTGFSTDGAEAARETSSNVDPGVTSVSSSPAVPRAEKGKGSELLGTKYDESGLIMLSDWHSRENKDPLILELRNLNLGTAKEGESGEAGNSVVVWGTMPENSERFCVNICPTPNYKEKDPNTVVLYHFNPRDGWGKKHVLQNAFLNGKWGKPDRSINQRPPAQVHHDASISSLPFQKPFSDQDSILIESTKMATQGENRS